MWFQDNSPPPSLLEVGTGKYLVVHSCSKRSGMTGYRSGLLRAIPNLWQPTAVGEHHGRWFMVMVEAAATAAWG